MQIKTTLFSKASTGAISTWTCWAEGNKICVEYGQLDGKQTYHEFLAKPKNVGRANETTGEQQAIKEVEARVIKQLKVKYFHTKAEAMGYESREPMLCGDYRKTPQKVKFPCYISPKLNGFRLLNDKGTHYAKSGETYDITNSPHHLRKLLAEVEKLELDGEIYAHGMPLQEIISAWRVPTLESEKLRYHVYDVPVTGVTVEQRQVLLSKLNELGIKDLVTVPSMLIHTQKEYNAYYKAALETGYEGVVTRNCGSYYEFGKRSGDVIKRKPRLDAEAKIISTEVDRLGDGLLTCQMKDGVTLFKCKMLKASGYRGYEDSKAIVGKWINYQYEELSVDGVPTKPVGIYLRDCDDQGNPLI